jgi:bla regulator protein blaR1
MAVSISGQTTSSQLTFDVASVKPANPSSHGISLSGDPSRFTIRNVTIKFLIGLAYNVKDFQILGGPHLLDSERYDIEATYFPMLLLAEAGAS